MTIDFRSLPKVSLHDHLDGGLRPQTIIELSAEVGHTLPTTDATELGKWFRDAADSGSLVRYLETFDHTIAVMQTRDGLSRVAREFVLDLHADGVIYGELRWAPEQHLRGGLTLDETVEAVQQGIEEGIDLVALDGGDIMIGQLVTAMRHADRGLEIAELAVRHRNNGVVGFDIAGAEKGFLPVRHKIAFDYLADQLFPVTVHAGEADGIESIKDALVNGRALRLGHGVRIAEDIISTEENGELIAVELGEVANWVHERQIPLELSPSSNLQTGAIEAWGTTMAQHPFGLLYDLGFNVTVNTDNRLMSETSLTRELELLTETFGYTLDDLEVFQVNAARASFADIVSRELMVARIEEAFAKARGE
jgi:adenosine deaminase